MVDGDAGTGDDQGMRTPVRRSALAAVLVAGAALLSACGDQPGSAAAPVSAAAATESATVGTDELAEALLPATAFGDDATVLGLSLEQLGQLPDLAGLPAGASIEPALCGTALTMITKVAGSGDDLPTLVAEGAFTDDARTLEVLADGPALDGLELPVDQLLDTCPTVTVTAPDGTATTVALAALDVPALGDAAAGLQVTVTGPEATRSALVGVVCQGSRAVLVVQSGAAGAAPDAAAFGTLLTRAADAATR